jgi:photosystem II stability/assembly factor-like uncharacterized protein
VLLCDGSCASWRQVSVPTKATLTGVHFIDRRRGWAVGHDAVILRSVDGGEHWERVHYAPDEERPLLDLWFGDARSGLAIGAYSYLLATADGGATWDERAFEPEPWPLERAVAEAGDADAGYDSDIDVHLNDIEAAGGGRLYIAAEAGRIFRSDDSGATWWSMPSPYAGSLFGVLPLAADSVLVFGLRGHLYRSDDGAATWRRIEVGTEAMLTDGIRHPDGRVILTGLAGALLVSNDGARSFDLLQLPDRQGIATALAKDDDTLILIGEFGLEEFTLPRRSGTGAGSRRSTRAR